MTGFDDDTPMTLDEAAKVLLRGAVAASTLRAAIGRQELACERIGRRIMVTPADIRAWRERCRVPAVDRGSADAVRESRGGVRSISAEIEASRAACRATLDGLRKTSKRRQS